MTNRILIIRLSALGDILHALPALAALRRTFPKAHLGWIVEDRGAPILQAHPMLDALHVIPRKALKQNRWEALRGPMRALVREVRASQYDTAIDFQGLTKSSIWSFLSGARRRIGFRGEDAREISRLFYNDAVLPGADRVHVIERNLALLAPLEIKNPGVEFPIHLPQDAETKAETVWGPSAAAHGATDPRIVLNPGAGWITKQWPAEFYGELAGRLSRRLNARVALAWGPGEEPLIRSALEASGMSVSAGSTFPQGTPDALPREPGVYPLPPTSFVELGAVLKRCDLFIGGDTGPTHFSAALGRPTLSIFSASDPRRNGPWGFLDQALQSKEPSCIPCWKTKCSYSEPLACLKRLSVDQVFERAMQMLGDRSPD